jgi:hypothetical protein
MSFSIGNRNAYTEALLWRQIPLKKPFEIITTFGDNLAPVIDLL